jgi:hypothetical protein
MSSDSLPGVPPPTNSFRPTPALKLFSRPGILQRIGPARLAKFLHDFAPDLKTADLVLPHLDPEDNISFSDLAAALAQTQCLPDRLRTALLTLEAAASPANRDRLQATTDQRLPCVSLSGLCPLDRALELWFTVPEELSQFAPPPDTPSLQQSSPLAAPEAIETASPTTQSLVKS